MLIGTRPFGVCCDCDRNTVGSLSSISFARPFGNHERRDCFTLELLVFAMISELLNMLLGSF